MRRTPEVNRIARPKGWILAFASMIFGTVSTVIYWLVWFFGERAWVAARSTAAYYEHQNAFPLADAFMATMSLLGAIGLYRRAPTTLLWMLLAGSASLYLGFMDVLYNLENRVYGRGDGGGSLVVELGVNVLAFAIPLYGIVFAWRSRWQLLGTQEEA